MVSLVRGKHTVCFAAKAAGEPTVLWHGPQVVRTPSLPNGGCLR